ncbi:MAG: terminase small subunit [Candidatus Brocadiaceae bacterium]|nr:terminase small subunit [Candidatus Brocadiaceae bacterium]
MSDKKELTEQQRAFCDEYIRNNFNAKQAAITAGYSEKTAEVKGSQLLSIVKVRDYTKNRINELLDNREELQKEWIDNVTEMAFYTLSGDSESDKYRASDKTKALELLGKYLTLFTEKKEVNHTTLDAEGNEVGMNINIEFTGD